MSKYKRPYVLHDEDGVEVVRLTSEQVGSDRRFTGPFKTMRGASLYVNLLKAGFNPSKQTTVANFEKQARQAAQARV